MTIKHLQDVESFEEALKHKMVVVDFYADWCGPCKRLAPALEQLAGKNSHVHFYKVNVEENVEVSKKYKISAMPTIIFFKSGEEVTKVVGADISKIEDGVKKLQD